jgi:hypothetical protein
VTGSIASVITTFIGVITIAVIPTAIASGTAIAGG